MEYDVEFMIRSPNRGKRGPIRHDYKTYNEFYHSACFGNFASTAGDPDVLGIVYRPTYDKNELTKRDVYEFYELLLEEFNFKDYLDGYPTVESILEHGAYISSELPTGNIMYLLTTLRYIDEYPLVVKAYLQIRRVGNLTEGKYFEWAHKIAGYNSPYGLPTGHSLLSGNMRDWSDGELDDLFLKDWDNNLPHRYPGSSRTMLSNTYRTKWRDVSNTPLGRLSKRVSRGMSDFGRVSILKEGIDIIAVLDENDREVKQDTKEPDMVVDEFKPVGIGKLGGMNRGHGVVGREVYIKGDMHVGQEIFKPGAWIKANDVLEYSKQRRGLK